jgi:hypothetical protein
MTGSLTPTNVVSAAQQSFIEWILEKVFTAVMNFLTSVVTILVDFFTQPLVLGALVTIAIVYWAWRMFKRKGVSM